MNTARILTVVCIAATLVGDAALAAEPAAGKNEPAPASAPMRSPDQEVEHSEKMAKVHEALAELTPRDQEVLLLWDGGLSYPEIAERTGLAIGAVGTTLARARKRLVDTYDKTKINSIRYIIFSGLFLTGTNGASDYYCRRYKSCSRRVF